MIYIFLLLSFSFSAVLNVPSDYRTINAAFDNVSDNDTVLVATGIHYAYKTIKWPQKNNISLIGDGNVVDIVQIVNIIFNNTESFQNNFGITE